MAQRLELQELREIRDFLVAIAKKAGDMITSAKPSTGAVGSKKNCKMIASILSKPSMHCV